MYQPGYLISWVRSLLLRVRSLEGAIILMNDRTCKYMDTGFIIGMQPEDKITDVEQNFFGVRDVNQEGEEYWVEGANARETLHLACLFIIHLEQGMFNVHVDSCNKQELPAELPRVMHM